MYGQYGQEYLGSRTHLAHLGENYAACRMPREVPTQWADSENVNAFYVAYDAYRAPADLFYLPRMDENAVWASEAIGEDRVSRYCSYLAMDADEYDGNPDIGESVSLVSLTDDDRVALTFLAAMDSAPKFELRRDFSYDVDWSRVEVDFATGGYAADRWAVVYISSQGFTYPSFWAEEENARHHFEGIAKQYAEDEDVDEDACPKCGRGLEGHTLTVDPNGSDEDVYVCDADNEDEDVEGAD